MAVTAPLVPLCYCCHSDRELFSRSSIQSLRVTCLQGGGVKVAALGRNRDVALVQCPEM